MQSWDESFDVIIVGFGFAGGVSAISAHDAGARVLLIEKMPNPGGISICSAGGIRTARDADAAFRYLKETNADTAPEDNLRVLAEGMTEISDFVHALAEPVGAELIAVDAPANYPLEGYECFGFISVANIPGFDHLAHFPYVRGLRGGARMFRVIEANIASRGIDVRLGTPAVELVRDASGAITGLVAEGEDGRQRIRATGGVILACGGFEAGEELKLQYWQEKPVAPGAFPGNTGDGIRMAQAVGADLWHMWHYHGTYGLKHPDTDAYPYGMRVTRFPDWTPGLEQEKEDVPSFLLAMDSIAMPWIVVDQTGRRYMNEYPPYPGDTGHRHMAYFDPVTQSFPRLPSYMIFDAKAYESYAIGFPTYNDPKMSFAWSKDNKAETDLGIIRKAESADDLAGIVGCSTDVLQKTLTEWNAIADGREEDPFGRQPGMGIALEGPPYYAAEVWPIVANTQGGPARDARQRILTPFKKPISGLYGAGELGSVFGHLYISGGNLAECFIGGRIAGREAAMRAERASSAAKTSDAVI